VAHGHGRQRDALGLEVLHHRVEALALLAQQVAGRDAHVVEDQLGGVGRQPARLLQRAAHGEARRAFLDDEHRHVALAGARLGGHEIQVGVHPVGDEHLGAVEHPLVAFAPRRGADARHVGAGARLGDAHGGDQLAGDDLLR
jgi:hypothetical protein